MLEQICGNTSIVVLRVLSGLFIAVLFLQSGIDKVADRKGNLDWLTTHFSKSPLSGFTSAMFYSITLLEVLSGVLCAAGTIQILIGKCGSVLYYGSILGAINILCLFFGQRIAKDYVGAQNLVSYFILMLISIYINS